MGSSWSLDDGSGWNPVNDYLVSFLKAIDSRLLGYLDSHDALAVKTVKRLRFFANAMLEGTTTPSKVAHDWADWFQLARAFVVVYGTLELADLEGDARLLHAGEIDGNKKLTEADRAYLSALQDALDCYPEMRAAGG